MIVAGIDGFKAAWVAVTLRDGAFEGATVYTALAGAVESLGAAAIGVDVPIGLPSVDERIRACDAEAKALVGPRRGSVFHPPAAPVADAASHQEAVARCRDLRIPAPSIQSWGLIAKIREAAAIASDVPVVEVHPEVTFTAIARRHGREVRASKHTWNGVNERRALLALEGIDIPDDLGAGGAAAPDDVVDAAAVAWTAARVAAGAAEWLPAGGKRPPVARRSLIWY